MEMGGGIQDRVNWRGAGIQDRVNWRGAGGYKIE